MTNTLKTNKGLRYFTFWLVTITVVGVPITLILQTDYAKLYKIWATKTYKVVQDAYVALPQSQKDMINNELRNAAGKTATYGISQLKKAGLSEESAKKLVGIGSNLAKVIIEDTQKKLK